MMAGYSAGAVAGIAIGAPRPTNTQAVCANVRATRNGHVGVRGLVGRTLQRVYQFLAGIKNRVIVKVDPQVYVHLVVRHLEVHAVS